MANFITRVELHKADNRTVTKEDYDILHEEMKANGFKTTIVSSDNKTYHLLTAEYDRSTDKLLADVLADAKTAASKVVSRSLNVKNYSAFVAEYAMASWTNLEEVKPVFKRPGY